MLRINLLPPYIYDKQKKFGMAGLWGGVLALVVIGIIVWAANLNGQNTKAEAARNVAQGRADDWKRSDTAIQKIEDDIANTKAKLTFVQNAKVYNDSWPETYELVRDWTSNKILLKTLAMAANDPTIVSMTGFSQSERNVIQWLIDLRNNPKFKAVQFTPPVYDYTPASGGQAGGAAGRVTGFGGGFGGAPFGPGGPVGNPAGSGGGFGGGPAAAAQAMRSMYGGGPGGGGFGGGASNVSGMTPSEVEGRRGIDFTVNVVLAEPRAKGIPAPTPPGGQQGGTGGRVGGFGGFGGSPMGPGGPPGPGASFGGFSGGPGGSGGGFSGGPAGSAGALGARPGADKSGE